MAQLDFPSFEKYLSAFDFLRLFADVLDWNHASSEAAWANDAAGDTPFSRRTLAKLACNAYAACARCYEQCSK
jgi:alkylhydroperoxidase family enzyme